MNVLQVSYLDIQGRRFNGYDLLDDLSSRGIDGRMAVYEKQGDDPRVASLSRGAIDDALRAAIHDVEQRHSMNNLLFPWGRTLEEMPAFREADVVHYQTIHNQMLSLPDLPRLFSLKPSVWTFHDPWPLTGHCVHPEQCLGWLTGCDPCPYLDRHFSMREDRAGAMWRIKERLYADLDVDIVVASEFMADMVRRSPLTAHMRRVHLIPFGVDVAAFLPDEEKAASRRALGLPEDALVLLFRATTWELKGLADIAAALASRPPEVPTTLLTVDQPGLLTGLASGYRVVDLGWVADANRYAQVLSACDMLLMPSRGEAFGLMAVEAMAAGRPVVCCEGTALESTTHAPDCGVTVPIGAPLELRAAIDALAADPAEAARRGLLGRTIAAESFRKERYLDSLVSLYRSVA